jgi:uncharacterized protein
MERGCHRIILDTNLWISFLITKNFSQLDKLLSNKNCILIFSDELLEEFLSVTKRPKFKRFFSQEIVANLLDAIKEFSEFVEVKSQVDICRDEKDNFLLALSKDGNVDFLITGDKDLLVLEKFGSTSILTFTQYIGD